MKKKDKSDFSTWLKKVKMTCGVYLNAYDMRC